MFIAKANDERCMLRHVCCRVLVVLLLVAGTCTHAHGQAQNSRSIWRAGASSAQESTGLVLVGKERFRELLEQSAHRNDVSGRDRAHFLPALPESHDLANDMPPVGNQGRQGSCVAWATAYYAKSYQERVEERWDFVQFRHVFSPAYIYNQVAGRRGSDTGMQIPEALNILKTEGCASLADFPYYDSDYSLQPSEPLREQARRYRIERWDAVDPNQIEQVKRCVYSGNPVIVAVEVDDALHSFRGAGVLSTFRSTPNADYHALCVVGYDDRRNAVRIVNSWGTAWGDNGYAWINYATFRSMSREAFVMYDAENAPAPPTPPAPRPSPIPQPQPIPPQPTPRPEPVPHPGPDLVSDRFFGFWTNPNPTAESIAALAIYRDGDELKAHDYFLKNGQLTCNGTWPVYIKGANLVIVLNFWFTTRNVLLVWRSDDCVKACIHDETSAIGSSQPAERIDRVQNIPLIGRLFERENALDEYLLYRTIGSTPR